MPTPATGVLSRLAEQLARLTTNGIVAEAGAFSPSWADTLGRELTGLLDTALARPDGAVGRGPRRYYVEIHPEDISGFLDLVSHPWVTAVCAAILGPDYRFVEVGFDTPLPGALDQPWHRDFPSPPQSYRGGRFMSLAFNVSTVDVTDEMGPLEIVPGTQWEPGQDWPDGMFPPPARWAGYAERAVRALPRRGDVSARSALTIHRGTANRSTTPRPTLVLGAAAAGDGTWHDLAVTPAFLSKVPADVLPHLAYRELPRLPPIVQRHLTEGLNHGLPSHR